MFYVKSKSNRKVDILIPPVDSEDEFEEDDDDSLVDETYVPSGRSSMFIFFAQIVI